MTIEAIEADRAGEYENRWHSQAPTLLAECQLCGAPYSAHFDFYCPEPPEHGSIGSYALQKRLTQCEQDLANLTKERDDLLRCDEQRVKDIARLTVERNAARSELRYKTLNPESVHKHLCPRCHIEFDCDDPRCVEPRLRLCAVCSAKQWSLSRLLRKK